MEIEVIFKIATIGILITVVCQILKKADRDDIATLVGIAGLIITLTIVIGMISDFFENIKSLFDLF
jgi:stage III sporulation protein AC